MAFYKTFYDNHKAPSQGNVSLPKVRNLWQVMRHDLSKYSPTEFLSGEQDFISVTEVRQRAKDVNTVIQRLGCTTKEETNITLNIGQTTIPKQDVWRRSKCR